MNQIFEVLMLLAFGAAWPFSIRKSWVSGSTAGKSIIFLWVVFFGYLCGIANKILNGQVGDGVIWFYTCNTLMVSLDTVLYYRNRRRERMAASSNA